MVGEAVGGGELVAGIVAGSWVALADAEVVGVGIADRNGTLQAEATMKHTMMSIHDRNVCLPKCGRLGERRMLALRVQSGHRARIHRLYPQCLIGRWILEWDESTRR